MFLSCAYYNRSEIVTKHIQREFLRMALRQFTFCGRTAGADPPRLTQYLCSGRSSAIRKLRKLELRMYTVGRIYYVIIRCSPIEFKTSTHCNLICCGMISPPLVLSPSSILPPPSSHCAFISAQEIRRSFQKIFISISLLLLNFVSLKLRNLNLRKSRRICTLRQRLYTVMAMRRLNYR